jgi:hypothetical protein
MGSLTVISWRDIPAQVIVKRGREAAKVQLSQRFQEAVDRAAMRAGKGSSDAYLADWKRSEPRTVRRRPGSRGGRRGGAIEAQIQRRGSRTADPRQGPERDRPRPRDSARRRPPSPPDVFGQAVVGAPCARPERLLSGLRGAAHALRWLFHAIGYERAERPVAAVEKAVKGLLFDCRMCGQCVLSSTGMSCPMNCPKTLRNGPCGGVRDNGHCEVKPEMRCVWVEAFKGSERIPGGIAAMREVQLAVDQRQQGRSSWLRVVRDARAAAAERAAIERAPP